MRLGLIVSLLLLLVSCGGGRSAPRSGDQNPPPGNPQAPVDLGPTAGSVHVALNATQDGNEWRVELVAPDASDLYQIGGTLAFDGAKYEVIAVEAGGGLGQPDTSYFVGQQTAPGRVDFAYTKRFFGEGSSGKLSLVHLRVRPTGRFELSDFRLDRARRLLARDSRRRLYEVREGAR
jgi:hypothetical protein